MDTASFAQQFQIGSTNIGSKTRGHLLSIFGFLQYTSTKGVGPEITDSDMNFHLWKTETENSSDIHVLILTSKWIERLVKMDWGEVVVGWMNGRRTKKHWRTGTENSSDNHVLILTSKWIEGLVKINWVVCLWKWIERGEENELGKEEKALNGEEEVACFGLCVPVS